MSRFKVGDKVIINKGVNKGKQLTILEVWEKDKTTLLQYYLCETERGKRLLLEENLDRKMGK